jgi:hypothetical protein
MMSEYPIGTLYDMANIPEEAVDRFLAELPAILVEVRRMKGVMAAFNDGFEGSMQMRPDEPSWVDDDLGKCTVTVAIRGIDEHLVVTSDLTTPATSA